jgi:hypothetical protein
MTKAGSAGAVVSAGGRLWDAKKEQRTNRRFEQQRAYWDFVIQASFVIGYFVIRHSSSAPTPSPL